MLVRSGPSGQEVDAPVNPIAHPPKFPAPHVCRMVPDHPGGANVLLGDGPARFWSETAKEMFAALSGLDEGELIDGMVTPPARGSPRDSPRCSPWRSCPPGAGT